MALSETFPAERSSVIERPRRKAHIAPSRIPITVRALLEWTYAEQKPHKGGDSGMSNAGGISQTGIVIERLLLGCSIDTSGGGSRLWGSVYCDDDALTVHGIVEMLPGHLRGLLIQCGEQRSAPDWQPLIMPLRQVPVPGRKGQPRGIYKQDGKTRVGTEMTFEGDWPDRATAEREYAAWLDNCHDLEASGVKHEWRPWPKLRCADEVFAHARQIYRDWYAALSMLGERLEAAGRRGLRRYSIAGLGASHEPWNKNNLPASENAA